MKYKILIAIVVLAFGLMGYFSFKGDSKIKPIKEYPEITNSTNYKYADDILGYLVVDVLKYDSISIFIAPLNMTVKGHDIKMVVKPYEFNSRKFYVGISDGLSIYELKLGLCHEAIHIDQYMRGDLKLVGNNYIWKGELVPPWIPYKDREFEIEAFSKQYKMLNKINEKFE